MSHPTISIAVPTYNDEKTIKDTLDSICAGTWLPNEIIVCDDASHDRTISIAKKYPIVSRVFQGDRHLGLAGNWNRCIEESTCDYLWILHSDDWISRYAVEILSHAVDQYRPGLILSGAMSVEEPFLIDAAHKINHLDLQGWNLVSSKTEAFISCLSAVCSSVIVKKSLYKEVGFFSSSCPYSPDEDLWPRLALREPILVRIGNPLTFIRTSGEHEMHRTWLQSDFKMEWFLLHERLKSYAGKLPVNEREAVVKQIETKRDAVMQYIENWVAETQRPKISFKVIQQLLLRLFR